MKQKKGSIVKESKSGEVQKLKRRIRYLEKKNERLISEIKTLEAYKELTNEYIGGELDGVPVERVIKGVQKKQKLKKVKEKEDKEVPCPKCHNKAVKVLPYRSGNIKVCGNAKCDYRETVKI
jgi:DNA-directed RNA polymerase subunit M/transcription elongation factor TFIIS